MFKGLRIEYPSHEDILHTLKTIISAETLKLGQEGKIQLSTFGYSTQLVEMYKILQENIKIGDQRLTSSYESFKKHIPLPDIEKLTLMSYVSTYGPTLPVKPICPSCGEQSKPLNINLLEFLSYEEYEGEPFGILDEEITIDATEYVPDLKIYLKMPTLEREELLMKLNNVEEIFSMLLYTHRFEYRENSEDEELTSYSDMADIVLMVRPLLPRVRKLITKAIQDNYSKYNVKIEYEYTCDKFLKDEEGKMITPRKKCKHKSKHGINIFHEFFRAASESELV